MAEKGKTPEQSQGKENNLQKPVVKVARPPAKTIAVPIHKTPQMFGGKIVIDVKSFLVGVLIGATIPIAVKSLFKGKKNAS